MISWAEYNEKQKHAQYRINQRQQEKDNALYVMEMCDCCGHNSDEINRRSYFSKSGMKYVIRYCPNCNPDMYWIQLGLWR